MFEVIELGTDKFEEVIWFDINLGTSKGMLVSKDLDLHTCIELLKSHSLFKGCRFIVDISERVCGSTSAFEQVNRETQHDNQNKCKQIMEIDMVEAQPITEEALQISDSIQVEGQSIIEIDNEQALDIQVLETAPVVRSSSTRYSLKCNDDRCGWCVRAFRIKDSTLFKIVKIEKYHDCSANTMKADQRHATSKLISGYIIDNLRDPRFEVTPAFVMAEMQKLHGLDIGYHKAWRAIQCASALIRGTPEENYELLSSYLYMMRSKNPVTYTNIKIDDNNRFLYMFYAYGSSISGWNHCRPVIAVDATFLKLKFHSVLMISVSKDANNQIFPLAFGIAESENNNSYEWYYSELRNAIGSRENLIFLSDRHQAIAYAITKVYPESHHGICIYHLEQNLKRRKVKSEVIKLFQTTARVYRRKEFDLYMSDIAKVDKKTYDYLMEEPPESYREEKHQEVQLLLALVLKESWLKTYERQIHPVGHTDSWIVPESVKSQIVKPPDFKVPPGRRQKKRHIPATESSKITFKYGRCRRIGHNRTTCIHSPAVHPFSRKHRE
ncbi:PREDICTED: uncharacterized protein LOC109209123 [Nicotiana attenuata]|uniref:uncharacterized protein LOC109209123 n=1 Tax=Nicotiana attenuata TaxID=49451 RepID=UPI000905AD5D|nr:PREDICTED: uncharacterized protein LOC109209123 [Nicotiana attenuata]